MSVSLSVGQNGEFAKPTVFLIRGWWRIFLWNPYIIVEHQNDRHMKLGMANWLFGSRQDYY